MSKKPKPPKIKSPPKRGLLTKKQKEKILEYLNLEKLKEGLFEEIEKVLKQHQFMKFILGDDYRPSQSTNLLQSSLGKNFIKQTKEYIHTIKKFDIRTAEELGLPEIQMKLRSIIEKREIYGKHPDTGERGHHVISPKIETALLKFKRQNSKGRSHQYARDEHTIPALEKIFNKYAKIRKNDKTRSEHLNEFIILILKKEKIPLPHHLKS